MTDTAQRFNETMEKLLTSRGYKNEIQVTGDILILNHCFQSLQKAILDQEKYRQSIEREHKERVEALQKENEDLRRTIEFWKITTEARNE